MRHVAEDREDDETGEEADDTAANAHDQCVSVDIVVVLVVASKCDLSSQNETVRKEDLSRGFHPHL